MYTHLVVLDDIMLCSGIAQGCLFPFPVAATTEFRDVACKYGGFGVGFGHYAMGAMAIGTDRCILVIFRGQHAMGAFIVQVNNLGMADGTIHLA